MGLVTAGARPLTAVAGNFLHWIEGVDFNESTPNYSLVPLVEDARGLGSMSAVIKPRGPHNRRNGLDESTTKLPSTPAPCSGCKNAVRCKAENIACDSLAVYVAVGASAARYAVAPRQPSAAIRERIEAFRLKRKTAPAPFRRPAADDEAEAD